jgi:ATP-dependent Lhr-like helicase
MRIVENVFAGATEGSRPFRLLDHRIVEAAEELGIVQETQVQAEAIPAFFSNENLLIISPTGSGKTEAALLPIFNEIILGKRIGGIRAVYITPLRALNRDMLSRVEIWGEKLGITVAVRHGDTPQKERRRQSLNPPEILITTPETLQVLLVGSRLRKGLSSVQWVVVDEVHHLVQDRRGAQLSVGLERLQNLCPFKIKRIGLSATVSNRTEISKFVAGTNRQAGIVDASSLSKIVSYRTEMPEAASEDFKLAEEIYVSPTLLARLQRILDLIRSHQSTLIFVNSRTNAEYLGIKLSALGAKIGVHHGSLPREERERIEQDFKTGRLPVMICTSTLELGIDIGSVDLVIQYMSPRQVGSMIQRVGRSGHSLSRSSEGITIAVTPEDALEALTLSKMAKRREIERAIIHECPLDVLAHQVAGILLEYRGQSMNAILMLCKESYCFRALTDATLISVVKYMETLGYLRFEGERIIPKAKCRNYYLENLSMIPDERRYIVIDATRQEKVGILGEEFMLIHARIGTNFVIKGRAWKIETIKEDEVYVTPVKDLTAAVPGWDGELLPIPKETALSVGRERGLLESALKEGNSLDAMKDWNADKQVRASVVDEIRSQSELSAVPTDHRIVIESWGRYIIIHTSAGDRINLTLGELFEETLLRKGLIRYWWNDGYRILVELTSEEYDLKSIVSSLLDYDEAKRGFLNAVIRKHFPFGYYMKFVAERFGALKRGLTLSSDSLKDLVVKFRFTPIYEETLREALMSKADVDGTLSLLHDIDLGRIESRVVETKSPGPLAMYVLSRYAEDEKYTSPGGNTAEAMESSIAKEVLSLLCIKCGNLVDYVRIESIDENPVCVGCGCSLIAPIFYAASYARSILLKKLNKQTLSKEEELVLTKTRRAADLVLSYGKQGIIAQSVFGVGPQTASKILSKMHSSDEEFYEDLLSAKLNFIRTREYWA